MLRLMRSYACCIADCDVGIAMQVVLQVVDENVARGSKVFERGHVRPSVTTLSQLSVPSMTDLQGPCAAKKFLPISRFRNVNAMLQILVLGFCDSQRDLEVVQKILAQVYGSLHDCLHASL